MESETWTKFKSNLHDNTIYGLIGSLFLQRLIFDLPRLRVGFAVTQKLGRLKMDPHSTHSQFNQRTPKSGPYTPTTRFMEQLPKLTIEKYTKPPPPSKSAVHDADHLLSLGQRPIATNSRVRQGEQFKRDMFIAFINKALQEKLDVRVLVCRCLPRLISPEGPEQRL